MIATVGCQAAPLPGRLVPQETSAKVLFPSGKPEACYNPSWWLSVATPPEKVLKRTAPRQGCHLCATPAGVGRRENRLPVVATASRSYHRLGLSNPFGITETTLSEFCRGLLSDGYLGASPLLPSAAPISSSKYRFKFAPRSRCASGKVSFGLCALQSGRQKPSSSVSA